ncbi:MAG: universal stress protein [Desulforhabdus sp.]|jgi:universal stress protein A|nr:universal stress protein [Desulforhabdus sp.]
MFKHILVPTDLTERTNEALDVAVKLAMQSASRLTLLHIIETIEDAEFEEFEDFYAKLNRRAQKIMQQLANRYAEEALSIAREISYGKRVVEIVRFAQANDIDLIVLNSHKVEAEETVQGWGTISYKVGILARCPVMLVK